MCKQLQYPIRFCSPAMLFARANTASRQIPKPAFSVNPSHFFPILDGYVLKKDIFGSSNQRQELSESEIDCDSPPLRIPTGIHALPRARKAPAKSKPTKMLNFLFECRLNNQSGKFIDGTPPDHPMSSPLSKSLFPKGMYLALKSMEAGQKAQFLVHSDYAFGPHGVYPIIPPHSDLFFEIEMLDIMDIDSLNQKTKTKQQPKDE